MRYLSHAAYESNPVKNPGLNMPELSVALFQKLGQFIQSEYGIKMPPIKRTMLQSRLTKRLRQLGMVSFEDYFDWLFSEQGRSEIVHMVDAVTTNKSDFFREPDHFHFIENTLIPEYLESRKRVPLLVWSAGCATGEEPYTLAMVLQSYKAQHPSFDYHILATDISTRVLEIAQTAIYPMQKISAIPHTYRKQYLLRSKDRSQNLVRIAPEIRKKVQFERLNLMKEDFGISQKMDVIFCRNVIIYFEHEVQKQLIRKLAHQLVPHGTLFLGHSETLTGLNFPFTTLGPNIYRKWNDDLNG